MVRRAVLMVAVSGEFLHVMYHESEVAETLRPGDLTFAHVQAFVDEVVTVTDEELIAAVKWLFQEAKIVAEPSGAATVAAALRVREPDTVAVVSGGNVDSDAYAGYIRSSPEPSA